MAYGSYQGSARQFFVVRSTKKGVSLSLKPFATKILLNKDIWLVGYQV